VVRSAPTGVLTFPLARARQERVPMLRKLLWTGLYAGLGAAATMMARRAASKIWRITTGEEPPAKK
jgi:hypothetical protein